MTNHKARETEQKALEINLDNSIYGTFAEIGAGQEVARYFFQVGAAAGTIAKTMSAYDKVVSDKIYGPEPKGRYVCESRLYKMLDHEYDLMVDRLRESRPDNCFFAFANTVAAINYQKTIKGDGWLGIRFQLKPTDPPNDLVIHVRMLDNDNRQQQQAIGVLGVNLIYACYRYQHNPETLLLSLIDNLRDRVMIDMVRLTGPDFRHIDNRLLSLWLIKHHMSDVAIFGPDGQNVHASELLYKHSVLVVRGSFRPATMVNVDMINSSREQFANEEGVDNTKMVQLCEITMDNLLAENNLDEKDFLDRADLLCGLGQIVAVTNCERYHKLIDYLADYKCPRIALVLGVRILQALINNTYEQNTDGRLLTAFGELFARNLEIYVYPSLKNDNGDLLTAESLDVPSEIVFLYRYLLDSTQVADLKGFHREYLNVYSKDVLHMIKNDNPLWETFVSPQSVRIIKGKKLFGYNSQPLHFEY
ncbi:MAG: TonB-dependent receptor [Saprospiraceae bacterium]|nr:TonB-dependent receptor [Saprospiraceae bacterium]MBP7679954.1 TonB-dependent receptor [Saprospiraceae bacterium]